MRKICLLIAISFLTELHSLAQNQVEYKCWVESYKPYIDLVKELDKLENQLIKLDILKGNSPRDYKDLYQNIENGEIDEQKLKDLIVCRFIPRGLYMDCNGSNYNPMQDETTFKYGLLFSLYLIRASEFAKINIEILRGQKIVINTHPIEFVDLKDELVKIAVLLENEGISHDEIITAIVVEKDVKFGIVSEVQQILRQIDLRKVQYSNR
jgi:hypothetical protein